MLTLLGDIHGNHSVLRRAIETSVEAGAVALVQVGDFGLFPGNGIDTGFYNVTKDSPIPVYFIDGNHDDCTRWTSLTEVTQIWDDANLFYVPRGTVMELDNRTVAFLGGAASIDKDYRLRNGWHWDDKEEVRPQDVETLLSNAQGKTIDMLITHCPPGSVIDEHFDPMNKLFFGVGLDWTDPSQALIQRAWEALGTPMVYSGHMHQKVVGMTYRILNIDELILSL
jgi:hypothetical protein